MKILIDECAPRALKASLAEHGHECFTVQEAGWAGKSNGELLSLAETAFDVLVTLDTNLRYQQNLARRRIAIVVIVATSNRLVQLSRLFPACAEALKAIKPGDIIRVEAPT
jgi:predicted nuclease of predicted toxin-antitoxin system